MPFSVLLEIALQPCGWLAAYCGSALTSPEDLSFRNLGGKATQLRAVTPDSGTLTTNVKMTNVSKSAGMIIQHYDMRVRDRVGDGVRGHDVLRLLREGRSSRTRSACREAKVPWPTDAERGSRRAGHPAARAAVPGARCCGWSTASTPTFPTAARAGSASSSGAIAVDPGVLVLQGPLLPGPGLARLAGAGVVPATAEVRGVEAVGRPARERLADGRAEPPALVESTAGRSLPTDREVAVVLEVTAVDDDNRRLTADGFLTVDGRVIYQMTDFTLE